MINTKATQSIFIFSTSLFYVSQHAHSGLDRNNDDVHPSIRGVIGRYGLRFTEANRLYPSRIYTPLRQGTFDGLCAFFGQLLIISLRTRGVRMPFNSDGRLRISI